VEPGLDGVSVELACTAAAYLDLTFVGVRALPAPGEEEFATKLLRSPGGGALNAIGAARLGVRTAAAFPLGADEAGRALRDALERDGIELVGAPANCTPVTVVMPLAGDRAMVTFDPEAAVDPHVLAAARPERVLCTIDQLDLVPAAARAFATVGDREARRHAGGLVAGRAVDTLFVNAGEAALLTGVERVDDAARALAEQAEIVVVSRGAEGALACVSNGDVLRAPGVPVDAVDTTGAGDLLAAAWVWGDVLGLDVEARLRWAVLYAALSVTVPTGVAGALSLGELLVQGKQRGLTPPAATGRQPIRRLSRSSAMQSHMAREMREQPAIFERLISRMPDDVAAIRAIVPTPLAGVIFVARGSSDNAATLGRYLAELAAGRPASLAAPALHTLYNARVDHAGYLAVALSQSGATPEINTVIERMRATGAATMAVTNHPEGKLASLTDVVYDLAAGRERAVPATKTVTAQMFAMAALAAALAPSDPATRALAALPPAAAQVLDDEQPARRLADRWAETTQLAVVSRGLGYPAALEGALKIKELTGIQAQGYSAADFRHGPIATLGPDTAVLIIDSHGPGSTDVRELTTLARERGGLTARCAPSPEAQLTLPDGVSELPQTLLATIRTQQLALELALLQGTDPDAPRGLSKVTPTN
jgi:glucosamine--fructose-6-phosphate aminotransferase (isomerizing)